jgi:hypothetical protein
VREVAGPRAVGLDHVDLVVSVHAGPGVGKNQLFAVGRPAWIKLPPAGRGNPVYASVGQGQHDDVVFNPVRERDQAFWSRLLTTGGTRKGEKDDERNHHTAAMDMHPLVFLHGT